MPDITKILSLHQDLLTEKSPWNIHYQQLALSFLTRKASFTTTIQPGDFLQKDLFDNTGQFMAQTMASAFLSMMWPDCSRSMRVKPVAELEGSAGVEEYFRFVNTQMQRYMDAPRAGLALALMEHFLDQAVFGTSGVGAFDGPDMSTPVVYEAWSTKNICVVENAQGFIDQIFMLKEFTVRQAVQEYGETNVSPRVLEAFKAGKLNDKIEVLIVISPRDEKDKYAADGKTRLDGVLGMACQAVHIDKSNKVLMRESGYHELPVFIVRFYKTIGEAYGRSPGMVALPDTVSLNALKEAIIIAAEKQLDPPLALLDDGRLGGGTIDTSAGALNVFNPSGRVVSDKPIMPLYTVGEMESAEKLVEKFTQSITQAFYVDRLLDLNNTVQMTAYETSVRNRMRGEALGSLFARQELELFTPLIERSFNILYRKGLLGEFGDPSLAGKIRNAWNKILGKKVQAIPADVQAAIDAGLDVFEIEYISPAKRFMQSEKLQGLLTLSDFAVQNGQVIPGLLDNVSGDELIRSVEKYSGSPKVLRTADEVQKIRADAAAQQRKMEEIEAAKGLSEVARNAGQAKQAMAQAKGMGAFGGK